MAVWLVKLLAMWRWNDGVWRMQGEGPWTVNVMDAHELHLGDRPCIVHVIKYRTRSLTFSSRVALSAAEVNPTLDLPKNLSYDHRTAFVGYDDIRATGTISELSVVPICYISHTLPHV
jgi:hypothetical protein